MVWPRLGRQGSLFALYARMQSQRISIHTVLLCEAAVFAVHVACPEANATHLDSNGIDVSKVWGLLFTLHVRMQAQWISIHTV